MKNKLLINTYYVLLIRLFIGILTWHVLCFFVKCSINSLIKTSHSDLNVIIQ